ncbi:MAG: Serine--tRNA ligase [candidate division TA06 bacterium ADurb.Bin131]|uniref:Serine--tRNA ligase n=1 Tax=candidate division TA06 bacterium ADurb.Bin131 TaxID=1852827 RepID=A0A1V6CAF7_UNCT6|nr:MAG: Serine--tRNA ligase [candidate division TA06 bacterium ADurb.Bin131]
MFPIKFVRENLDLLKKAAEQKNAYVDWDAFREYENERRKIIHILEEEKRQHKKLSQELSILKQKNQDFEGILKQARQLSDSIKDREATLREIEEKTENILASIPNIPHPSVPVGKSSEENIVVRTIGEIKDIPFDVIPHYEIGKKLDILHLDRGAKISGSFFPVFSGHGARLVRALINFMLDTHTKSGYKEIWPPSVVNRKSMFGTGQLPKLEEDMYRLKDEDMFLIPTAEVPVTNFHREETLSEESLPIRYCAYTPCFRREAGAYGKDTKGLMRLHQFDKVELVVFCRPEVSYDEHEVLVKEAEKVLQMLEIPYRVVLLCTGDMSFAASKCYDIEVWAPGVRKWLEVSSCSNFEDFQARRADIRYRAKNGKTSFVHTLNGSGIALPRTIIAIMENYQTQNGTIIIPEVLRQYMDGLTEIK